MECSSPAIPRIREVKKVGFLIDNLSKCEEIFKGKEYEAAEINDKRSRSPIRWREMHNSMLNISVDVTKYI
jgi:hypothetical protein